MEEFLDRLEAYILAHLNPFIADLSTEALPLVAMTDTTVITGDCSITRYGFNNILFINPDRIRFGDLTVADYDKVFPVDLLFVCRGAKPSESYRRVLRYAAALIALFLSDENLAGVGTVTINEETYFDGMEGSEQTKGCLIACEFTI